MDRKLVVNAHIAIARGHRIEVTERVDELTGESGILSVLDLESGIRYRSVEAPDSEILHWTGRVVDCTVVIGGRGSHTSLTVTADSERGGSAGARVALHAADAAVDAAKAEADRWGGGDRLPEPEPDRFW